MSAPDRRPDVLLVLTDQHRADVSAREGFPLDTTPFLDALAAEGTWFDAAYTTAPLCCPARTSLLTGRFPSAHRVTQNPAADLAVFDRDLFDVARAAGYTTAMIGKNHTYLRSADVDHWVEFMHFGREPAEQDGEAGEFEAWLAAGRHRTPEGATPFSVEVQNPHRIVDEALDWIRSVDPDRPLLAIVSFPEPHNPYQVPEPYFSMFPPETLPPTTATLDDLDDRPFAWRYLHRIGQEAFPDYDAAVARSRSNYFGMLRLIDDEVRRLLAGIEDRHAARERLVVVTADHGDYVGEYGLVRKGAAIADLLARVPFVVAGDRVARTDGPAPAHVSLADVLPTICEAISEAAPFGAQGRSLWPVLTGAQYPEAEFASVLVEQGMGGLPYGRDDVPDPEPGLFDDGPHGELRFDELNAVTQSGRRRKLRSGRWTLDVDITGHVALHDVRADPMELVDLADDPAHVAVKAHLLAQLAVWQLRVEDPLPAVPTGYPLKRDARGWVAPHRHDDDPSRSEVFDT